MLREIFGDFREMLRGMQCGVPTRTITVSKPYCSPARNIITSTFDRYGVKIFDLKEKVEGVGLHQIIQQRNLDPSTFDNDMPKVLPVAQVARVTVSEKQAVWAEYLLLRTGKLSIVGQYQNRRNEQWAKQHRGRMPPAWQDGQPWIERSCSDGMAAWQPLTRS